MWYSLRRCGTKDWRVWAENGANLPACPGFFIGCTNLAVFHICLHILFHNQPPKAPLQIFKGPGNPWMSGGGWGISHFMICAFMTFRNKIEGSRMTQVKLSLENLPKSRFQHPPKGTRMCGPGSLSSASDCAVEGSQYLERVWFWEFQNRAFYIEVFK